MKTLSHRKEANAAPKYTLMLELGGLYLSAKQGLTGINFTENPKKAMQYAVGFDNPETKLSVWNAAAKIMFNTDVTFQIVNL